jgi:phytoene synthase
VSRPAAPAGTGLLAPELRSAYDTCRRLHASHGRTYYLATRLLPAWKRPYVHALYGFARYADELVDGPDGSLPAGATGSAGAAGPSEADAALRGLEQGLLAALASEPGRELPPAPGTRGDVLRAVADTAARWDLPAAHFTTFLAAMRMDLTVREYDTWQDLLGYVEGSAAVIGLMMLPILEPSSRTAGAYARDLGIAFQHANFLRDVGEDLRRGRIYLPQESLRLFGVTRERLLTGVVDGRVRRLLAHEIARGRELFRSAEPGIRLLHPTSRDCIRTAYTLYGEILDAIEDADYQVLDRRVTVTLPRRLAVAGPALWRAARAR